MTLGTENRDFAGHKFSVVTGRRGRHPIGHPPIIQIEPTSKIRSRARSQRAYRRRTAGRIIAAVELRSIC